MEVGVSMVYTEYHIRINTRTCKIQAYGGFGVRRLEASGVAADAGMPGRVGGSAKNWYLDHVYMPLKPARVRLRMASAIVRHSLILAGAQ